MKKEFLHYVIGVDGGGAKTAAVLADWQGKILAKAETGSSSPRNLGLRRAMDNVSLAIERVLKKNKKISATFLGLPAMEEEFKLKKELVKKELLKHKEISPIFKGKVIVGSDQLAGFRSGTNEKDGVVLIGGSGCVAHGWRKNREVKVCGWGYFSEMGSAFWVGQKALQAIWKELDSRGPKTLITKLVFRKFKMKNKENLIEKIYSKNPTEIIPSLAILVDEAAKKGDVISRNILTEAGKELALSTKTVIKKLNFQKIKFPLVLIGSMFNSKIVLDTVKKDVKKFAPRANFIRPKVKPAIGAVKLAIEQVQKNENTKTLL
ncbi:MAG: BadF/BadG/BcrA/BcrD ATPase family protein [Patescibacteria group bacterium]|nr:BadF/BadG/BcrA/BcrD ATPase family protein [Patescibacteria group bacterium]